MNKKSVCMATYNGEKYIKKQLLTILKQLEDDDEVIISDDSSIDNTVKIIKSIEDSRIILIENQKFKSPIFNFENALKNASHEYIYLCDQDDLWFDNKVDRIQELLLEFDLVLSDATVIDMNENLIYESFFDINSSKKGFLRNLFKNSYNGCAMAFNTYILKKSLPFPKDIHMHDWWIGLNAEIYGKVYFFNQPLLAYRRHGENFSASSNKSHFSIFKKINIRIILIKNIILKLLKIR